MAYIIMLSSEYIVHGLIRYAAKIYPVMFEDAFDRLWRKPRHIEIYLILLLAKGNDIHQREGHISFNIIPALQQRIKGNMRAAFGESILLRKQHSIKIYVSSIYPIRMPCLGMYTVVAVRILWEYGLENMRNRIMTPVIRRISFDYQHTNWNTFVIKAQLPFGLPERYAPQPVTSVF